LRLVDGQSQLAEDVAQTVFMDLARQAPHLPRQVRLGGWLHRHTCFVACKLMRAERRRQKRERQAVEMNTQADPSQFNLAQLAPLLDEAINQLGAKDRTAILLRFFEQYDLRAVGAALGSSENAAQKRVTRALEELRMLLKRRGVTLSATVLATALAGEAVSAAPAGLAAAISSAALTAGVGTGTTLSLSKFMALTKLQFSLAGAVVLASVAVPLIIQHQAQVRLRERQQLLQERTDQIGQLRAANQRLSMVLAGRESARRLPAAQFNELLRLRGEVGQLHSDVRQLTQPGTQTPAAETNSLNSMATLWSARAVQLKQWLEENPAEAIPELRFLDEQDWINSIYPLRLESAEDYRRAMATVRANAQQRVMSRLFGALRQYARTNNGAFPSDLSQLVPYLKSPIDDAILQRYEIVPADSLASGLRPGGDWAITQKAPVDAALDLRMAIGLTTVRTANQSITNRWVLAQ
jgi:RNA polymerase sigma factor (sigma-70 family)